jgi:hypothetical protein
MVFYNDKKEQQGKRSVKVDGAGGAQQLVSFTVVTASWVTVHLKDSGIKLFRPLVKFFQLGDSTPVRPVPVDSCTASSHVKGRECEYLYDGLKTYWLPVEASQPAWVKFEFGGLVNINRMWIQHSSQQFVGKQLADLSSDAWAEVDGKKLLTLEFSDGKTTVNADVEDLRADNKLTDSPVLELSLVLPNVATSFVKMTVTSSEKLIVTDVLFWNSRNFDTGSQASSELVSEAEHWNRKLVQYRQVVSKHSQLQDPEALQTRVRIFGWIKDAAETAAMELCLAGLAIANAVLSIVQGVINGIASVLIMAMEAAIKAMGPHFFEIMDLGLGGSFDALAGGKIKFNFNIDMWLFNIRIKWGFKVVFTLIDIIKALFGKATSNMAKVFRL